MVGGGSAGDAPAGAYGRRHVAVAATLAGLTLVAFYFTAIQPRGTALVPVILVLALTQIVLQVLFYMRLRWVRSSVAILFVIGAVSMTITAWSIWYMLRV